jgi:hypothetical protein
MKKFALKAQVIVAAAVVLWSGFSIAQILSGQTQRDEGNARLTQDGLTNGTSLQNAGQSTQIVPANGERLPFNISDASAGPLQGINPRDGSPFRTASASDGRVPLRSDGPLQEAGPLLTGGPLRGVVAELGLGPLLGIGPLAGLGPLQGTPPLLSGVGPIGIAGPIDINVATSAVAGPPSILLVSLPQETLQPQVLGDSGALPPSSQPNSPNSQSRPEASNPFGGPTSAGGTGPTPNPVPTCAVGCGPPPTPPNNVPAQISESPPNNAPPQIGGPPPNNVPPQGNGTPS